MIGLGSDKNREIKSESGFSLAMASQPFAMRQIQSRNPFSSSSLLPSQTKLIDLDCRSPQLFLWRPWLHRCGRRKGPERCFTLPSPIHHCVIIFIITTADPSSWYHRCEVFKKILTCSSKWAACSPTRRRREAVCNHLDMSRGYFSPLLYW